MDSWLVNCFATLEPEDLLTAQGVLSLAQARQARQGEGPL